jgi:NDP-sugar pyrophosphorylase family protein
VRQDVTPAILAGGLGTRLRSAVADRPKVLASVHDRPYLTYLLDRLVDVGFQKVVLLTGYGADHVYRCVGQSYRDLHLIHSPEPAPLGTAGAVRWALAKLDSAAVLLMNGDSWCDVDLASFRDFHERMAADASLVLAEVTDVSRFGIVQITSAGRVSRFSEKEGAGRGFINAGIYLLARRLLEEIPDGRRVSLESDMLPSWVRSGRKIYGFEDARRFLDIGTPESYAEAEAFFPPHARAS